MEDYDDNFFDICSHDYDFYIKKSKRKLRINSGLIIGIILLLFYVGIGIMSYNMLSGNTQRANDVCDCKEIK